MDSREVNQIRVIDLETCGLDPSKDAVVQIGWTDILRSEHGWDVGTPNQLLVDPQQPIPPEASAIHHFVDADIKRMNAQPLLPTLSKHAILDEAIPVFAAFNAAFDGQFIAFPTERPVLCGFKCAVRLAPNARRWTNQYLRYAMRLELDDGLAMPPHEAGPDSYVTAHVIARMLVKHPLEDLLRISAEPTIYPRLRFGKHKDQPCEDIPASYWEWILGQGVKASPEDEKGFEQPIIDTAEHYYALIQERNQR